MGYLKSKKRKGGIHPRSPQKGGDIQLPRGWRTGVLDREHEGAARNQGKKKLIGKCPGALWEPPSLV